MVTLTIAVALLKLQPYVSTTDDLVSTMAQWVLFLHVFAGLLTRVQANQPVTAEEGGRFNAKALSYVTFSGAPGLAVNLVFVGHVAGPGLALFQYHCPL